MKNNLLKKEALFQYVNLIKNSYPQLYKQVQGITLVTFGVFNNIIIFNKKRTAIKIAVLFLEI